MDRPTYRLELGRDARKQLLELPKTWRQRVDSAIRRLATEPRRAGTAKIRGAVHDLRRARVGEYRIIYAVLDDRLVILVVAVGPRQDIYRHLEALDRAVSRHQPADE